jgi:hypothetical protein
MARVPKKAVAVTIQHNIKNVVIMILKQSYGLLPFQGLCGLEKENTGGVKQQKRSMAMINSGIKCYGG